MKISTKGRYGLRAMLDLAMNSHGEYVPLSAIAERQCLSVRYLEGIFSLLKRAGLVIGSAGSQGGYMPAHSSDKITMKMILDVLEGSMSLTDGTVGKVPKLRAFLNKNVWDHVDHRMDELLASKTISDMILEFENRDQAADSSGL